MKPMYLLILVILLGAGLTPNVTAATLPSHAEILIIEKDECDEIDGEIVEAEKEIRALKKPAGTSELDKAKAAYDEAKEALADIDTDTETAKDTKSSKHGTKYAKEREAAEQQLADARIAYGELLAKLQALYDKKIAALEKYKEKCGKRFAVTGGKDNLTRSKKARDDYAKKVKTLADDAAPGVAEHPKIRLKQGDEESDKKYRERLGKLPWIPPTRRDGEKYPRFKKRFDNWEKKFKKSKWAHGFWKKVAEALDKKIAEILESLSAADLPDDQGALPDRPDRNNNRLLRLAAEIERSNAAIYSPSTMADVEHFLYADPEQYHSWVEALEGEFALGGLSGTTNMTFTYPQATFRYGVVGGIDVLPQLEANFRLQYGQTSASFAIPMLVFSTDGTQKEIPASWTVTRRSLRVNGSIDYRLGNGNWQILAGPRMGLEQRSGTDALSAGTQYAEHSLEKDRLPFYGLGLGLRRQLGNLYGEVRTNWETQEGRHHFSLGLRIGMSQ